MSLIFLSLILEVLQDVGYLNIDGQLVVFTAKGIGTDQLIKFLTYIGSHSVDKRLVLAVASSLKVLIDQLTRLQSIHDRHIDVKNDHIEVVDRVRCSDLECLHSVFRTNDHLKVVF